MSPRPIDEAKSPDLPGSWHALQRAALRAREIAARTGTSLVIFRNGVVEHISPVESGSVNMVQEDKGSYEP
jgi:hypothetical protein